MLGDLSRVTKLCVRVFPFTVLAASETFFTFLEGKLCASASVVEETMSWGTDLWVSLLWCCDSFLPLFHAWLTFIWHIRTESIQCFSGLTVWSLVGERVREKCEYRCMHDSTSVVTAQLLI